MKKINLEVQFPPSSEHVDEGIRKAAIFRHARYFLQMAEIADKHNAKGLSEYFMKNFRGCEDWMFRHDLEEEFVGYMTAKC